MELTGGIVGVLVSRRVLDADAVLHHQPSELGVIRDFPDRIPVGLKDQLVADGIEGDHPVRAIGVIRVTETAKEIGMVAMSVFVLVADADRLDAINVNFHAVFTGGIADEKAKV